MYVDASTQCNLATFQIAPSTGTSRQWDITVTQYACGDEDKGGPPGCLQYYTGTFGRIQSFAFPSTTTVAATSTIFYIFTGIESGNTHLPSKSGFLSDFNQILIKFGRFLQTFLTFKREKSRVRITTLNAQLFYSR